MEIRYIYVFGIRMWSESFYMTLIWVLLLVGISLLTWYTEK